MKGLRTLKTPASALELTPVTEKEFDRVTHLVSLVFNITHGQKAILNNLKSSILKVWKNSGVKFTIVYLSECLRLVCVYIAEDGIKNKKTWVATYCKTGLPKILGIKGRQFIIDYRNMINSGESSDDIVKFARVLISFLSFFRMMSPVHVLSFSTVTDPLKEGSMALKNKDIYRGLSSLGIRRIKTSSPRFIWSNKAGVNTRYAFLSIGLDMLGIIAVPRIWWSMLRYAFYMGYYLFCFIFVMASLWCLPFFIIFTPLVGFFRLGRLSIVKELRGKARVVGITDMWTQMLFKPLHDSIYDLLENVPEDGTKDQLGPVKLILKNKPSWVNSVDLSAATDRLPVELQARILSRLGVPGHLWRDILLRPYNYMDVDYVYAVGQPMGAYSSFAMLALTNHVIVHASLSENGVNYEPGSGQYAVLGDDVAIAIADVASTYIQKLEMIGVEVNPIKGFTGKTIEFAKTLFHGPSGANFTPVGAKIVIRAAREPIYFVTLLKDLINKGYLPILGLSLSTFNQYLQLFGKNPGPARDAWLFAFLGPQSGLWGQSEGNLDKNLWRSLFDQFLETLPGGSDFASVTRWYENRLIRLSVFSYSSVYELGEGYLRIGRYSMKPWIWPSKKFEYLESSPQMLALLTCATGLPFLMPILFWYYLSAVVVGLYLATVSKLTGSRGLDNELLEAASSPISAFINYIGRNAQAGVSQLQGNELAFREQYSNYLDNPFLRKRATKWPIHTDIGWFVGWLGTLKFKRPMQLLAVRFIKTKGVPADDMLPAVKTARSCLSTLAPSTHGKAYRLAAAEAMRKFKDNKNKKGGK
nr:MAG: RNA-dependent RNA polymerase [Rhizoctonia solani mitovirus 57]